MACEFYCAAKFSCAIIYRAPVAELVDAADSKSAILGCGSSTLPGGTTAYKVMQISSQRRDVISLCVTSFCESAFLPIAVDPLLATFVWKHPTIRHMLWVLVSLSSVCGGILGYCFGAFAFMSCGEKIINFYSASAKFETICLFVERYGCWAMLLKSFIPLPFKIVVMVFGFVRYNFLLFVVSTLVARGMRFCLIAYIAKRYKGRYKDWLMRHVDKMKWIYMLLMCFVGFLLSAKCFK